MIHLSQEKKITSMIRIKHSATFVYFDENVHYFFWENTLDDN